MGENDKSGPFSINFEEYEKWKGKTLEEYEEWKKKMDELSLHPPSRSWHSPTPSWYPPAPFPTVYSSPSSSPPADWREVTPPPLPDISSPSYHFTPPSFTYTLSSEGVYVPTSPPETPSIIKCLTHPAYVQWEGKPAFEGMVSLSMAARVGMTSPRIVLEGRSFFVEKVLIDEKFYTSFALDSSPSKLETFKLYRVIIRCDVYFAARFALTEFEAHSIDSQYVRTTLLVHGPYSSLADADLALDRLDSEGK